MAKEVVGKEAAAAEVEQWLDYKGILPSVKEANQPNIDFFIECVQFGRIMIDNTSFELTHKLTMPILDQKTGQPYLTEIVYSPRLTVSQFESIQKEKNETQQTKMIAGFLANKPANLFDSIQASDLRVIAFIAPLFLA